LTPALSGYGIVRQSSASAEHALSAERTIKFLP
jgi:hypothetical protein